jgi:hypothetical protein
LKTIKEKKIRNASADTDNLNRAEIRCFLCTTTKAVRYNSLRPVTIEAVFFDNFRERIAVVLVKYFRADIPARPTADAGPTIDGNVHIVISRFIWYSGCRAES